MGSEEDSIENAVASRRERLLALRAARQLSKFAPAVLPKFEDPISTAPPPEPQAKEDPFLSIAPKKPNWDLRRDVQKKLEVKNSL